MHPKELIPTSATKPPKYKVGDCVSLKEKYLMELKEISIHDFSPENFLGMKVESVENISVVSGTVLSGTVLSGTVYSGTVYSDTVYLAQSHLGSFYFPESVLLKA